MAGLTGSTHTRWEDRCEQLQSLRDQRFALILVCLQQCYVDLGYNLCRRLKLRDEVADEHVGSVFVDDVFKADIVPGKFDDILSSVLK